MVDIIKSLCATKAGGKLDLFMLKGAFTLDLGYMTLFWQTNQLAIIFILASLQVVTLLALLVVWRGASKRYQRLQPLLDVANSTDEIANRILQLQNQITTLDSCCQDLQSKQTTLAANQQLAIQKIGFYRYNAFPDTGGQLSFSIAVLDGQQNGFVLTSRYGRQEARVYAKEISGNTNLSRLSLEEEEAIRRAVGN